MRKEIFEVCEVCREEWQEEDVIQSYKERFICYDCFNIATSDNTDDAIDELLGDTTKENFFWTGQI